MKTLVDIQHLVVEYDDRRAVDGASLVVNAGQVVALIGPNGAGKTSLIRAASGVIPFRSGMVRLAGRNILQLMPAERARLVAVVPQARQLPGAFSALELVNTGRTAWMNWLGQSDRSDREAVRSAMLRTDTASLAGRRVGELSGGEQQRLLLARALAQDAPVLMLDEPSAHLDLRYQVELLDRICGLARDLKLGVLVALHDLNLVARIADRVVLLVSGRVMAGGTVRDVLQPNLLSEAYGTELVKLSGRGRNAPVILPA